MTSTLISTEPLLAPYQDKLLALSIRWIEQFVCQVDAAGLDRVAQYLGTDITTLKKLIDDIKAKHPEMILPENNGEDYHLGCRID